jgi:hypothetical protein
MNEDKLRAWWWHRSGLDGTLAGATPAQVLERSGWARSVGGVGPYLSLFARAGISREDADAAVSRVEISELPAARGCTYIVPRDDFAIALTNAQPFGASDLRLAEKLGVTLREVDKLCDTVEKVLGDEPLDPDAIKERTGKAVRNLGEEGKKKGMITTLPLALGILQSTGRIRRVPVGGRLDQQRFRYVRWEPSPLNGQLTTASALTELARRFFRWVGPATMKEFQWFSGAGVKVANDAVRLLGLVDAGVGEQRLMLPEDRAAFDKFSAPTKPQYALVSSLDAISATRRDVATLLVESDRAVVQKLPFEEQTGARLMDLAAHAILDRGRLIGYWEFDSDAQELVWMLFAGKPDKALLKVIAETEAFVRDQLGDARSFSLDSPKSRAPKLARLRAMAK